jgi:hypothetical protein
LLGAEVLDHIRERVTRVEDVFDDDDLARLDRLREILEDPHVTARFGRVSVRRDFEEVERQRDRHLAHEVGEKRQRALEDAHEDEIFAAIVIGDRRAKLAHLRGDRLLVDEHFGDVVRGRSNA